MASIRWMLLLFLVQLYILATSRTHGDGNLTLWCHPDQAVTLLQLKQSFICSSSTAVILPSWQIGTDCCFWEGISCDAASGLVTVLDLSGHGLQSDGFDPLLFCLESLQRLDLSMNYLGGNYMYNITTAEFEKLALLTHLNLSNSALYGRIPIGISKLVNLVSLDLSSHKVSDYVDPTSVVGSYNSLWEPNFESLVANLSNLIELYLDGVQIMSSNGEEWGKALASSVPHLQVLSLSSCGLDDPIHHSLASLHSLSVIALGYNDVPAGPIPEFFTDFVNLSVLNLPAMNLQGRFPHRFSQIKNLKVLDLSLNPNLLGYFPNFSRASSLETLRLEGTNISCAKQTSSSNFQLLRELSLDWKFLSVDFVSSFGTLRSLSQLEVHQMDSQRDLRSFFSWIGDLRNLISLSLYGGDFSWAMPSSIGDLRNLISLSVHGGNFSWTMSSSIGNLKAVRSLRTFGCNIPRPILSAIGNLMHLEELSMSGCKLRSSMPSSIGNLTNLRSLYIQDCDVFGTMPASIGYLNNLRSLRIDGCDFSGAIPSAIGNLTNLENIIIAFNKFSGPIPYAIGQLKELKELCIINEDISGRIPSSVVNMTRLEGLTLQFTNLDGKIPASVFALPVLWYLNLQGNQLSGPIEEFYSASSCLKIVGLTGNGLAGQFPKSFFQLAGLELLRIDRNNFVGSVDLSSFCGFRKLNGLDISHNKLSVVDEEGNNSLSTCLSGLDELGLANCNLTKFPSILTHLDRMSYLDLSSNKITGDTPKFIWERWSSSLYLLNLSHNMFTGLQLNSYVLPFSMFLAVCDLSSNRLQGHIPMPNSSAQYLDYSHNFFSSVLPNFTLYLSGTSYLSMSNNSINGYIPNTVCNYMLDVLDLSYNNFSGPIPSCLIEKARLSVLNLRQNQFEGTLPSNITTACTLKTIDLHGNKIEGKLQRALSNCTYLEVLDIGNNLIVDTFPSWLSGLPNLHVLVLRSNQFYGSIGDLVGDQQSKKYFSSLQIIDLASNNFSGNLTSQWFKRLKSLMAKLNSSGDIVIAQNISVAPGGFYQDSIEMTYKGSVVTFVRILTTFTAIDFSNNRLEGTIPESVGYLVSLHVLNMSHNAFTGKIPAQLGHLTDLESLDLSCNQLSEEIPQELTDITFLAILNLSDNQLVGKIPQSRQFLTFDSNSFEGNMGLCGLPLSNPCSISPSPGGGHVEKSSHVDVILFLFVGMGFGVGFAAAFLMRWGWISEWFVKSARALRT